MHWIEVKCKYNNIKLKFRTASNESVIGANTKQITIPDFVQQSHRLLTKQLIQYQILSNDLLAF